MASEEHTRYDPWGIGEALSMGLRMYIHAKRATGRTTMLLDSLKEGDMVIAATDREAKRIERLARDRGLEHVIGRGYEPRGGRNPFHDLETIMAGSKRRVVFDHTFFEALYWWMIHDTQEAMADFINRNNRRCARTKEDDLAWLGAISAIGGDPIITGGPDD